MFTLRKEGTIIGVMSSNVDDLLYGSPPEAENMMKVTSWKLSQFVNSKKESSGSAVRRSNNMMTSVSL